MSTLGLIARVGFWLFIAFVGAVNMYLGISRTNSLFAIPAGGLIALFGVFGIWSACRQYAGSGPPQLSAATPPVQLAVWVVALVGGASALGVFFSEPTDLRPLIAGVCLVTAGVWGLIELRGQASSRRSTRRGRHAL